MIAILIITYFIIGFVIASLCVYNEITMDRDNTLTMIMVTIFWPIAILVLLFIVFSKVVKKYADFLDNIATKKRNEKAEIEREKQRKEYEEQMKKHEEEEKQERAAERKRRAKARARAEVRAKSKKENKKSIIIKLTKKLSALRSEPLKNRLDTVE